MPPARAKKPLLFPPPSPPSSASRTGPPYSISIPRRSLFYTVIALLPLIFIFTILLFAFYAYFISLVLLYLLFRNGEGFKALSFGLVFLWLWGGCTGSVGMAYWVGGGFVGDEKAVRMGRRDDEESGIGGVGDGEGVFALGGETDEDDGAAEGVALLQEQRISQDTSRVEDHRNSPDQLQGKKLEARVAQNRKDPPRANANGGTLDFGAALRDLEDSNAITEEEQAWGTTEGTGRGQAKLVTYESGVQVKRDGGARWCRKCNLPKPDRAHHCSSCNRCVRKMDHHCPWLGGGCVGWRNYKFFLLFLWYGGALGIWVAVTTIQELMAFVGEGAENLELAPVSWAFVMLAGCVFGFTMTCFGLYHLYLAGTNCTTIEQMEPAPSYATNASNPNSALTTKHVLTKNERKKLEKEAKKINIYNLGFGRNLREIFGGKERWYEWGMPWGVPPGDGRKFPVDEIKLERLRRLTREIRGNVEADHQLTTSTVTTTGDDDEGTDGTEDSDGSDTREEDSASWHR